MHHVLNLIFSIITVTSNENMEQSIILAICSNKENSSEFMFNSGSH